MLKIETQAAFNRLPMLLLAAMRHPPVAVMVARGDLGVEVGFERLSEVQEEILWLCEAAHVPVIWATQVLESLAKGGMPSRAEVTDAAMGSRAECVMLNKGPVHPRDAALPDRRARADGGASAQEVVAAAETACVGRQPSALAAQRSASQEQTVDARLPGNAITRSGLRPAPEGPGT